MGRSICVHYKYISDEKFVTEERGGKGERGRKGMGRERRRWEGEEEKTIVRMRIMATALYRIKRYRQNTVVRVRVVLMLDFLL